MTPERTEREAFDSWWNGTEGPFLDLGSPVTPRDHAWTAWRARAALSTPPAAPSDAEVERVEAVLVEHLTEGRDGLVGTFRSAARAVLALPALSAPRREGATGEAGSLGCFDCGLAYGGPGWIETRIQNDVWAKIAPKPPDGGVLCPCCIASRLHALGYEMASVPMEFIGTEPVRSIATIDPSPSRETGGAKATQSPEMAKALKVSEAWIAKPNDSHEIDHGHRCPLCDASPPSEAARAEEREFLDACVHALMIRRDFGPDHVEGMNPSLDVADKYHRLMEARRASSPPSSGGA